MILQITALSRWAFQISIEIPVKHLRWSVSPKCLKASSLIVGEILNRPLLLTSDNHKVLLAYTEVIHLYSILIIFETSRKGNFGGFVNDSKFLSFTSDFEDRLSKLMK